MCHEHRVAGSKLKELCSNHCYSPQPCIAAQAIQILTEILCYWHVIRNTTSRFILTPSFSFQENLETDGADDVIAALETLILLLTFSNEKHPLQLKIALKCAVRLCEAKQDYCEVFVELLGTRLDNIDSKIMLNKFTTCLFITFIFHFKIKT